MSRAVRPRLPREWYLTESCVPARRQRSSAKAMAVRPPSDSPWVAQPTPSTGLSPTTARRNSRFVSGGLSYEIGVCIQTGHVVWVHGPFRCGQNDITTSRQAVLLALNKGEKVEADLGYKGEDIKINTPNEYGEKEVEAMKGRVRSRHETVNQRIRHFGILEDIYRHRISDHSRYFRAVAVITQLNIETNAPLFPVDYEDYV